MRRICSMCLKIKAIHDGLEKPGADLLSQLAQGSCPKCHRVLLGKVVIAHPAGRMRKSVH